ncbi:MAG: cupin domain-containing protein [Myxococcales bacterium]|nr:cupin domain-containing protein [Myxococcales bacterium]
MNHIDDDTLLDLALGTGEHRHLATCADCRAALDELREAVHLLAFAAPPHAPPPALRARLLAAVAGPITDHRARVAALLGLPQAHVDDVLDRVHRGVAAWTPVLPDIDLLRFTAAGPREAGLIRVAPGAKFPYHRHLGDERVVVLQGSCSDSGGRQLGPGDEIHHTVGTGHHLEIHPGPALVFAFLSDGSDFAALP